MATVDLFTPISIAPRAGTRLGDRVGAGEAA